MNPGIAFTLASIVIALCAFYASISIYRLIQYLIFQRKFKSKLQLLLNRGESSKEEKRMFRLEKQDLDRLQKIFSKLNFRLYMHIKNLIYFVELSEKLSMRNFIAMSILSPFAILALFNIYLPQLNVFSIFGIMVPYVYLLFLRDRKIKVFVSFFPGALESMASNLKAGADIIRAVAAVAEDEDNFFAKDFRMILSEIELGVPINEAFQNYAAKIRIPEVELFSMGITLSMESGANLATFFVKISDMIRKRIELKGKINIVTSESRFSMLIMILTPVIVALAYSYIDPDRYVTFLKSAVGQLIIYASVVMITIAVVWVNLMMRIEE